MSKAYIVRHLYSLADDYGDPVEEGDIIFVTTNRAAAEKWVERWNHPIVYDESGPYEAYRFRIEQLDIVDDVDVDRNPGTFDMMWLPDPDGRYVKHVDGDYILDRDKLIEVERQQTK